MKLELFMFPTCPYCRRVIGFLEQSGRTDVELYNIHENKEDLQRLVAVGGMNQVPCLFIDGKPLYESLDIIAWLKEHPQEQTEAL